MLVSWIVCLVAFHLVELFLHHRYHSVSFSDFYLDVRYVILMFVSIVEYFLPIYQLNQAFKWIGFSLFAFGIAVRLLAKIQLKSGFNLILKLNSKQKVMQTGLYGIVRHPGYAGFWLLVIGGQLLLGNTLCTLVSLLLLKIYFEQRIRIEERLLSRCNEYAEYKKRVRFSGIPFVET